MRVSLLVLVKTSLTLCNVLNCTLYKYVRVIYRTNSTLYIKSCCDLELDVKDKPEGWLKVHVSTDNNKKKGVVMLVANTIFKISNTCKLELSYPTSEEGPQRMDMSEDLVMSVNEKSDYSALYDTDNCSDPRRLMVSLCKQFWNLGWVTGTGGSISIKHGTFTRTRECDFQH